MTREEWLMEACFAIQGWMQEATGAEQPYVFVSVGFTGIGGRCQLDKVLGSCWVAEYELDSKPHVFISPVVAGKPYADYGVLHVLTHELCHAAARTNDHSRGFKMFAQAIGLCAPWRTTPTVTAELRSRFYGLADRLGEWTHEPLKAGSVPRKRGELLVGNAAGYEARIVIPTENREGKPLSAIFVNDILLEAAELFGGYTCWQASGGYVMADGRLAKEKVYAIDLAVARNASTKTQLEALALKIKLQGDQESVYLRLPGGRVEFV